MKVGVISDVHGNLIALNAVIKDLEKKQVNEIWNLGDNIPKYTNPKEVMDFAKNDCTNIVKGNGENSVYNNPAYTYTRDLLGINMLNYIGNLPNYIDIKKGDNLIRMFHSSPYSFEHKYIDKKYTKGTYYEDKTITDFDKMFENTSFLKNKKEIIKPNIVLSGHTHVAMAEKNNNKILINPGSVGEPVIFYKKNEKIKDVIGNYITYAILVFIDNEMTNYSIEYIDYTKIINSVRNKILISDMATKKTMANKLEESQKHFQRSK
ncbi:MAG: metallophosphoesterase family protein [Bacilli bacterium]